MIHGECQDNPVATGSVEITPSGLADGNTESNASVIPKGGFFDGNLTKLKEGKGEKPAVHLVKEEQVALEG